MGRGVEDVGASAEVGKVGVEGEDFGGGAVEVRGEGGGVGEVGERHGGGGVGCWELGRGRVGWGL